MGVAWLAGLATALQLNFGLERKTPRGNRHMPPRGVSSGTVAFSVARASVAPQSEERATEADSLGVTCTSTPLRLAKRDLQLWWLPPLECWDSVSLPHLISFANVCVARYAKCHSRETRTPKGVCAGRGRERMWLLAKRTQGKGRKGGLVWYRKKAGALGGRLFYTGFDRMAFQCSRSTTTF